MITKRGLFGDYNTLYCDTGEEIKVYPYKIDFPKVYQQSGFFLLRPHSPDDGEYTIINYLLDDKTQAYGL